MILGHRIKLDPNVKPRIYFAQACGTARMVWNWALSQWQDQYRAGGKLKANEPRTTTARTKVLSRRRKQMYRDEQQSNHAR
jgi:transposase